MPYPIRFDASELNDDQLGGYACVVCGAQPDTMTPVGATDRGQVFACIDHIYDGKTDDMPAEVEQRALKAGNEAARSFRIMWKAEQKAREALRAEDHDPATNPPSWLAADPCPTWCLMGTDHRADTDPEDRGHYGVTHSVAMQTMKPITSYARYTQPEISMALEQKYREREARICVFEGDDKPLWLTLDEAEQFVSHMQELIRQARFADGYTALLKAVDSSPHCDDSDCVMCQGLGA